jgi:hypothetical protein
VRHGAALRGLPQYGGGVHGLSNPSQLRSRGGKKPHDGGPDRTGDRDGRRVLSGLGGIGGGVVLVPVLVVLGLTAQEAGGTLPAALLMPLGLLGTFEYTHGHQIKIYYAIGLAAGLAPEAGVGADVAGCLPDLVLQCAFGIVLIFLALKFLIFPTSCTRGELR